MGPQASGSHYLRNLYVRETYLNFLLAIAQRPISHINATVLGILVEYIRHSTKEIIASQCKKLALLLYGSFGAIVRAVSVAKIVDVYLAGPAESKNVVLDRCQAALNQRLDALVTRLIEIKRQREDREDMTVQDTRRTPIGQGIFVEPEVAVRI